MRVVHRVPQGVSASARLDRYLADAIGISRRRLSDAFAAGEVRVNGKRAKKGDKVDPGSEITAEVTAEPTPPIPQPDLPLTVLREDASFLVLDKPAGMPAHPLEEGETGTLANALVARYPECATASEDLRECGLAHRLDVETSGAIVAARSAEAWRALRASFGAGDVEKRYLALVGGAPGEGGEIDIPIAHHPKNARKMIACALPDEAQRIKARPALTRYRVLERLGDFALVDVEIPTGVMHQIRVHLAAVGAPVVGDALYGGPMLEGLARHFLHAARLAFAHPHDPSGRVQVSATLPPELEAALQALRRSCG